MRIALTAGESMDLVLLHEDGTRTDVRIENDSGAPARPVITATNLRRRAPLVVLVNGERKLP
ncbi:hypothetical protein [Mycolicibacterium sp. A43C]